MSELVRLIRSGDNATINVTVETVPLSTTTSTPAKQHGYRSCEEFFMERLQTNMNTKKVNKLRDSRQSNNLFLHAEMQIALVYVSGTITFRAHNVPVGQTIRTSNLPQDLAPTVLGLAGAFGSDDLNDWRWHSTKSL
jgi:hypothetical protein